MKNNCKIGIQYITNYTNKVTKPCDFFKIGIMYLMANAYKLIK